MHIGTFGFFSPNHYFFTFATFYSNMQHMRYLILVCFTFFQQQLHSQQFAALDSAIERLITGNKVSGGVAMVWKDGSIIHQKAYGWRDPEHTATMQMDAIFRIASQTKLIVTVAALQLVSKNKISLDQSIAKWLPEFSNQYVAQLVDGKIELVERKNPVTLRHLLTHTSGISSADEFPQFKALFQQYQLDRSLNFGYKNLEEEVAQIARMPLMHEPGARFSYGNSTDVLARWIEVVSGLSLGAYLDRHVFKPLQMRDTHFKLPVSKAERLIPINRTDPSGKLVRLGNQLFPADFPINKQITLESGAGGLVSTASDYLKLLVCLVNDGEYGGSRKLLPTQWIDSLCTGQLGGAQFATGGVKSKNTFGLGVGLTTPEGSKLTGATPGSFFWGGAFNTSYLADRAQKTITVFLFQRVPFDLAFSLTALERLAFIGSKQ
jgi:CubicO group peptidase (beta-lactamase class C family)